MSSSRIIKVSKEFDELLRQIERNQGWTRRKVFITELLAKDLANKQILFQKGRTRRRDRITTQGEVDLSVDLRL